jgi:hypothetical protein
MAPRRLPSPGTRPTANNPLEEEPVDTLSIREKTPQGPANELLAAACEAMRLLQDRQAHTPEEMLDPREARVLRLLRSAVRQSVGEGEEV